MSQYQSAPARLKIKQMALCVAFAIPAMVQAQQTAPTVTLPEVKVQANALGETTEGTGSYTTGKSKTATPLSMSLRDTPQSVTVVTQQRMEDQGLLSIEDVVNNVTGVSSKIYDSSRSGFAARGFDIDNLQIDGIPVTWQAGWSAGETMTDIAIYDRVEIVRGATGLMTGAGNPSAAINLVRKRANSKELTGSVLLGVGSWNQRRAMADLSTSVNEAGTLRARVVGSYLEQDSWIDLLHDKKQTFYGTLEADLTDRTLLSIGASRQENSPTGSMWGGLSSWYSDGTRTNWDRSKTTAADWTTWSSVNTNYFAKLEHRFDNGWKLQGELSRAENDGKLRLLWMAGRPDRVTGLVATPSASAYDTTRKQDNAGIHVSGPFGMLGRQHEAAFGYMHSKQKLNSDSRAAIGGGGGATVNFNDWDGSFPEPSWGSATFYQQDTTTQNALYGMARFSLSDPLRLILGARVSTYEKSGNGVWVPEYTLKYDNEITPYAGLVYDLNDTYSLYASYTDIFQMQNAVDRNLKPLDPIVGKSYEAGVKSEFFNGLLNASLAVFHIKQDNLAQPDGSVLVGGAPVSVSRPGDGITSDGYEFDVSGEIARNWSVSAGWTQFDARDADGVAANTRHPRKLFRLFTTYRLPGELNKLSVGGGVNWEGNNYTPVSNPVTGAREKLEQSAYSLVNLMARYEFSKQLSAQLNINNVFDEKYYSQIGFYNQYSYGAPRNASLTLRYKF